MTAYDLDASFIFRTYPDDLFLALELFQDIDHD
jgi:hypothetical protein